MITKEGYLSVKVQELLLPQCNFLLISQLDVLSPSFEPSKHFACLLWLLSPSILYVFCTCFTACLDLSNLRISLEKRRPAFKSEDLDVDSRSNYLLQHDELVPT